MAHATVNGVPATLDDLVPLAFAGYGHYSSMQVRDGRVRGLRLHLDRLRAASAELFGTPVPDERVREYIRATVTGDASVEVYMFGSAGMDTGAPVEPSVLVRAGEPGRAHPSPTPVGVRTARFGRWRPEVKNLARMGAVHLRRQARIDGFDDVLFVGDDGLVAEGSTWNVLFLDADGATVFPVAPMLMGTTVQLIRAGLSAPTVDRPVHVDELGAPRGAVWTSSNTPARPIAAIDGVAVPVDEDWLATLRAAFSENVPEVV